MTLTDSVTRLFKRGKLANAATIAGSTTDEGFDGYLDAQQQNPTPRSTTTLDPSTNRITNLTDDQVTKIATFYAVNATYGSTTQDNFFLNTFAAYWIALGLFGDAGIFGSERLIGRCTSAKDRPQNVWTYRFNAPSKLSRFTPAKTRLKKIQPSVLSIAKHSTHWPQCNIQPRTHIWAVLSVA